MDKLLIDLDKDIKRCEDVLLQMNHLEVVIAVEELVDKYKVVIKDIYINNDKVWNYTKNDLEVIKNKLHSYKNQLVSQNNKSMVLNIINETKQQIIENEKLSKDKINENLRIISELERINDEEIEMELKWNKLKEYIVYSSDQEINIGSKLISIINLILNNI